MVQALVVRAAREDAVRDLDTMILQTQLALLEDPEWNRPAAIGSMRVSRELKRLRHLLRHQDARRKRPCRTSITGHANNLALSRPSHPL
ncbi:MAG: hypothetical protein WB902_21080 [Acetobacteraceae bacterium]